MTKKPHASSQMSPELKSRVASKLPLGFALAALSTAIFIAWVWSSVSNLSLLTQSSWQEALYMLAQMDPPTDLMFMACLIVLIVVWTAVVGAQFWVKSYAAGPALGIAAFAFFAWKGFTRQTDVDFIQSSAGLHIAALVSALLIAVVGSLLLPKLHPKDIAPNPDESPQSNGSFASAQAGIESVVGTEKIEAAYLGVVEFVPTWPQLLQLVIKLRWSWKIALVVALLVGWALPALGLYSPDTGMLAIYAVLTVMLVRAVIKGIRPRPDMLLLTPTKAYHIEASVYNKATQQFELGDVTSVDRTELRRKFGLARLNPMVYFLTKQLRFGDRKLIVRRGLIQLFMRRRFLKHTQISTPINSTQLEKLVPKDSRPNKQTRTLWLMLAALAIVIVTVFTVPRGPGKPNLDISAEEMPEWLKPKEGTKPPRE